MPTRLVSEAQGDVCATHIAYPKLGHVTLYVAKNQATKGDEVHLARLVGLCQGDFLCRWPDYLAFKQTNMELLISFCEKKIRKRLKELSCEVLLALIAEFGLESYELKEFEKWDEFLRQGEAEILQGNHSKRVQATSQCFLGPRNAKSKLLQ